MIADQPCWARQRTYRQQLLGPRRRHIWRHVAGSASTTSSSAPLPAAPPRAPAPPTPPQPTPAAPDFPISLVCGDVLPLNRRRNLRRRYAPSSATFTAIAMSSGTSSACRPSRSRQPTSAAPGPGRRAHRQAARRRVRRRVAAQPAPQPPPALRALLGHLHRHPCRPSRSRQPTSAAPAVATALTAKLPNARYGPAVSTTTRHYRKCGHISAHIGHS
jgi:hypothetical protein